MRKKSFVKMVIKEPKLRLSKELRQAGFKRKAGRMGKRKEEKLGEIIKKELKNL